MISRRFARWRELPTRDRWRLLGLALLLPVISVQLRLFGYVRTLRWLERTSGRATARIANLDQQQAAEHLVRLAAIAGRHGAITATCLRQALLIYWLLRRSGLTPSLRIGVRRQVSGIDAHAWVELQGVALGQIELAHFPFPGSNQTALALR